MAGPRVMFGVYPGSGCGNSSTTFIPEEAVNDMVGGIFQNLFNHSGAPTGARMFGSRPCGPRPQPFGPDTCHGGFWSEFIDPQHRSFAGKTCNRGERKGENSKESQSNGPGPKCRRENRGKTCTDEPNFGGKKQTTSEPTREHEEPFGNCFHDFQKHLHHFMTAVSHQWSTAVTLKGFDAEEIKVKVDDEANVARIHALHESGDGESFDRREAMRIVKLPEDIIPDSVKVSYRPGGVLVIVCRRQPRPEEEKKKEKTTEEKENTPESDQPESSEVQVELSTKESVGLTSKPEERQKESSLQSAKTIQADDENLQGSTSADGQETFSLQDHIISIEDSATVPDESKTTETQEKAEETDGNSPVPLGKDEFYDITKAFVLVDKDGDKEDEEAREVGPFSIELDVSKFTPEQVAVKVSGDTITVTAEDKEEQDGYYSMRKLQRSFPLPRNINPEDLKSTISPQGVLTVVAHRKLSVEKNQEKTLAVELE